MNRTFLICDSPEHAEICDQIVVARLRDELGTHANRWSGVYTNGESFGILWAEPVSSLFGHPPSPEHPDGDPSLVLVEEGTPGEWSEVPPDPAEESQP